MKKQSNNHKSISIMLLLILINPSSTRAQEVEDEREFDYIKGSEKGPSHWGELKKEWTSCKNGKMQSPIDLSSHRLKLSDKLGDLKKGYKSQNATLINRGHDIELKWEGDAGFIKINGSNFFLQQCHWHSPSEHTINSRRYEMEVHLVHTRPNPDGNNNTAVVALLYKIGRPDPFLSTLAKYIKEMTEEKEEKRIGEMDPMNMKMGGKKYYRYMGSLTTPPCTQGVIWTINKKIRTVSRGQVKLLREAVYDYAQRNARPLQPLNGRRIQLYDPKRKQ